MDVLSKLNYYLYLCVNNKSLMKSYLKIENAIIKKVSSESLSFGDLFVAPDEFALARFVARDTARGVILYNKVENSCGSSTLNETQNLSILCATHQVYKIIRFEG